MKTILSISFILLLFSQLSISQDNKEQLVVSGELANVYVEKCIYNSPKSINFFIQFRIENKTNQQIAVDLSDYWKVIYPNQWGIYPQAYRMIINERRLIPDSTLEKENYLEKFKNQDLTFIEAQETITYYRDWNGNGEKVTLQDDTNYLILTVDGEVIVTDGNKVERLMIGEVEEERAIIFEFPVIHRSIPEQAFLVTMQ